MQALINFAQANPALIVFLWTAVLWPVFTAVANKSLDVFVPRAEAAFYAYEQVHPRVAAMAKILRKLGFDPHALVARLHQVLSGKAPPLPASFGVEMVPAPATTGVTGAQMMVASVTSSNGVPAKDALKVLAAVEKNLSTSNRQAGA